MREEISMRVNLFVNNVDQMKQYTKWEVSLNKMLSALIYANEGRTVEGEAVVKAKRIIKDNTGFFSQFKGNSMITIATLLALSGEPEVLFQRTNKAYQMMKEEGFSASDYLTIASVLLASNKQDYDFKPVLKRSKEFYDLIKKDHRFLTGRDDYIFVTMLGMAELPVKETAMRIEKFYQKLRDPFFTGNGVQALSEILVLSNENDNTLIARVNKIYDLFKNNGYKLKNEYIIPMLGIIAILTENPDSLIQDIIEVHDYLKSKKGFGSFSMQMKERMMFSTALVCGTYIENLQSNNTLINATLSTSITNILLAQQAAIISASSASAAAAAASSSSN